jgi:hypothetical protein
MFWPLCEVRLSYHGVTGGTEDAHRQGRWLLVRDMLLPQVYAGERDLGLGVPRKMVVPSPRKAMAPGEGKGYTEEFYFSDLRFA